MSSNIVRINLKKILKIKKVIERKEPRKLGASTVKFHSMINQAWFQASENTEFAIIFEIINIRIFRVTESFCYQPYSQLLMNWRK